MWLFPMVSWVGLQCVIVLFPDHSHLLFVKKFDKLVIKITGLIDQISLKIVNCHVHRAITHEDTVRYVQSCAYPESFFRGGPTLTTFRFS